MKIKVNPYWGVLLGVAAVSSAPLLTKISLNNGTPPVVIAFYRLFFTTIILLPLVLGSDEKRNELVKMKKGDFILAIASGLFLAFHFVSWFYSLIYTSTLASTVLVCMQPLFVVIFGYVLLGERIQSRSWLGIFIAILGMVIIGLSDMKAKKSLLLGDFLAVCGAAFIAAYFLCGRILRQKMSLFTYSFTVYGVCTVILLVWATITKTPLYPYRLEDFLAFLGLAVICTIFGHTVFNWALKYVKTSVISMSILGEPVGAALLTFFILGEVLQTLVLVGGAVTMAGVLLFNCWEGREEGSMYDQKADFGN